MSEIPGKANYRRLPDSRSNTCFGCSSTNSSGMHMIFHIADEQDRVVSWYSVPGRFCGWGNVVHGGIVSTMLDEAMGMACIHIHQMFFLSKSIMVEFISPVFTENNIRIEGAVKKINSKREAVLMGNIYNEENKICAKSSSVVSTFTMEAVKKLGFLDEALIGYFESIWDRPG